MEKDNKKPVAERCDKPNTCLTCTCHSVIEDPDPDDWFCDDDIAVVCRAAKNPRYNPESKWTSDRQEHRCVTSSCRPYRKERESAVPEWCPLGKAETVKTEGI